MHCNDCVKTRVLVIGATGMLGSAVYRLFAQSEGYETYASVRSTHSLKFLPHYDPDYIVTSVDVENSDCLINLLTNIRPDIVINCVGLIKQRADASVVLSAIPTNTIFPHRLASLCGLISARLVHISTDCVFSGNRGAYIESDYADAKDLYGISKFLGEVDYPHAITLRTSIIGHELAGSQSLIDWFLSQKGEIKGFKRAVFSGLPTVELAKIIRDYVILHPKLHGLYHVSADPITKYDLLTLVADTYGKSIDIIPDYNLVIDRSLDSTRFKQATGFKPKSWPELVCSMRDFG